MDTNLFIDRVQVITLEKRSYDLYSVQPCGDIFSIIDEGICKLTVDEVRYEDNARGFSCKRAAPDAILYYHTIIANDKTEKIIFNLLLPPKSKVWCNREIVSIHGIVPGDERRKECLNFACAFLQSGENEIVIEIAEPMEWNVAEITLMPYRDAFMGRFDSLRQIGRRSNFQDINIICSSVLCADRRELDCMCMANDDIFSGQLLIQVVNLQGNVETEVFEKLNMKFAIPLPNVGHRNLIDRDLPDEPKHCHIIIRAAKKNGGFKNYFLMVILEPVSDVLDRIETELRELPEEKWSTRLRWMEQNLEEIRDSWGQAGVFWECDKIYHEIHGHDRIYPKYDPARKRQKLITYQSKLDNGYERILVREPKKFKKDKKYPLFVTLAVGRYSWDSICAEDFAISDQCIYADVSMRGPTLGCYVGEANILESLELLKKEYQIDEERVFLMGVSNGAYGVWHMLQRYPDMFAGACALGGMPDLRLIENLYTIPIIQLIAENDKICRQPDSMFTQLVNNNMKYNQVIMKNYTHTQILNYIINKRIMGYLLSHKREHWPAKFSFTTNMNRYIKSFWGTILGIREEEEYAQLKVELIDSNEIDVSVTGANGVTLMLPPGINKTGFLVKINGYEHLVSNYQYSEVKFLWSATKRRYMEGMDVQGTGDDTFSKIKGAGIIYPYYGAVTILISDKNEELMQTAKVMAEPMSNAQNGKIMVQYPIHYLGKKLPKGNIIFVGLCNKRNYDEYFGAFPIRTLTHGFVYQDRLYNGNYVVMQVRERLDGEEGCILKVETNCLKELRQVIFLRRLLLPGDSNGRNPYLNEMELMHLDGKYINMKN